jgi:hypothetical protein
MKQALLIKSVFAAVILLLASSAAQAVPLRFDEVSPRRVAYTDQRGGVYAGIYNILVGEEQTPFDSFCIDFFANVPKDSEEPAEYQKQSLEDAVIHPGVAVDITRLWYKNYDASGMTRDAAAGLQIAIWEVTLDDDYNVFGGNFSLRDGTSDYGAQDYLDELDPASDISGYAPLVAYTNGQYQDFVTTEPVPEPSTIMLMGVGLLGLVGYSRRRFLKKS